MYQAVAINNCISTLSKQSFAQRIDAMSLSSNLIKGKMTRLNNQLSSLCERLHDAYADISETDYKIIKPYLTILLDTLGELSLFYRNSDIKGIDDNIRRLQENIEAIEEINSDIRNFRIGIYHNPRYHEVVTRAKSYSNI